MNKIYINDSAVGDIMIDPQGVYMGPHYYNWKDNDIRRIVDQYLAENQIFIASSTVDSDIRISL